MCIRDRDENLKRLRIEEVCSGSCCTDGGAEEDRNDVHQLVLCGLVQTLCYAAVSYTHLPSAGRPSADILTSVQIYPAPAWLCSLTESLEHTFYYDLV